MDLSPCGTLQKPPQSRKSNSPVNKCSNPRNIAALFAATLITSHTVNAASVFADSFSGATVRTAAAGGFGNGTAASVGNYVTGSGGTFSIQGDTTTGPAEGMPAANDSALQLSPGASIRAYLTQFPVQNLTTTGDKLTLSFDFRFTTTQALTTAGDLSGIRFGLFESIGAATVNNNSGNDDNDKGYRGGFAVDGPMTGNTSVLGYESGTDGSILSGTDFGATSTGATAIAAFGTTSHNIALSLERTATGLTLRSFYDGTQMQTQDVLSTATGFRTTFNELAIGIGSYGSSGRTFRVDNIDVDLVPEPSPAFLLGTSGILCLIRRRRA